MGHWQGNHKTIRSSVMPARVRFYPAAGIWKKVHEGLLAQ